ncbi:MAG: hypothetical protein K0S32_2685 [Bacteroidetes bacterium]|jgi:hypothetical protein|nr:hypothetical protein [Bacteroidota bacterium]
MRKTFFSIILFVLSGFTIAQSNDTLYRGSCGVILKSDVVLKETIQKMDLKKYFGKTVKEFLQEEIINKYKDHGFFVNETTGEITSVPIEFTPGLRISIVPKSLKYTDNFSKTFKFDFEKFKKEKIGGLKLEHELFDNLISDDKNKTECKSVKTTN